MSEEKSAEEYAAKHFRCVGEAFECDSTREGIAAAFRAGQAAFRAGQKAERERIWRDIEARVDEVTRWPRQTFDIWDVKQIIFREESSK